MLITTFDDLRHNVEARNLSYVRTLLENGQHHSADAASVFQKLASGFNRQIRPKDAPVSIADELRIGPAEPGHSSSTREACRISFFARHCYPLITKNGGTGIHLRLLQMLRAHRPELINIILFVTTREARERSAPAPSRQSEGISTMQALTHDGCTIVGAQIVGTQKGGTTALFEFLSGHPRIATPRGIKNAHFFDNDAAFAAGRPDNGADESLFSRDARSLIQLAETPAYIYWRTAATRFPPYYTATKLIMLLRDPVERAVSQWEMEFSRGTESELFEVALTELRTRDSRCAMR